MEIKKAVVIGAGVMGSGIAAQLANAGIEVELLDIVPKDYKGDDRDFIARGAIDKMKKTKPKPLMHPRNAKRIRPGNTEDHMDRIADADLIIEAVIEKPSIKSNIFKKIDAHRKEGSIVGSNTSTIPLATLSDGQSDQFKKDFVITHFFNPPRYMPLMELVSSDQNDPEMLKNLTKFMDEKMGKSVIDCKDTPGFIANRIGTYWLTVAMNEAINRGMTAEEADAVGSKPMGVPKTGVFGLVDLVGLDLIPHISNSLYDNVPEGDDFKNVHKPNPLIEKMIAEGYTGRKGKGGFYRLNKVGDKKIKEVVDLTDPDGPTYSPVKRPKPNALKASKKGGLKALVDHDSKEGEYAWEVLKKVITYSAELVPEIADDFTAIDDAMKLGYAWKYGPFELADRMGVDFLIGKLENEGTKVPAFLEKARGKSFYRTEKGQLQSLTTNGDYQDVKRPEGVTLLEDVKRTSKPVIKGKCADVWDIGDGVLCFELKTSTNTIDPLVLRTLNKTIDKIESGKTPYKALVIHNGKDNFSFGANIGLAMYAAKAKQYWMIDKLVKQGQDTYKRLKYANFPVVGAPKGLALGGGCEILLHCDKVTAHAETYMGLVEVGVGLIPGWGGCAEMMARAVGNKKRPQGPMPPLAQVFEMIATAQVPESAEEAKSKLYLRDTDEVVMNKSRLLAEAKKAAIELSKDYQPPKPTEEMQLPGPSGRAALRLAVNDLYAKGIATHYDVVIADQLAEILSGGQDADVAGKPKHEDDIRELERKIFMRLVRDPRSLARVESIVKHNKPLREKPLDNISADLLRRSLKGATDLQGKAVKFTDACKKKLTDAFAAAKKKTKPAAKKEAKPAEQSKPGKKLNK